MKALGYTRVSTFEQAASGFSLEHQEATLRSYAEHRGLELIEVIEEAGTSASVRLADRDGGKHLLARLDAGEAKAVIAIKLDRLFRDSIDCLTWAQRWTDQGIALHLLDMGGQAVDTSTAIGRFFLTIVAGVAEMERNLIRERIRAVLQHKRRKGHVVGSVPYGYRAVGTPHGRRLRRDPDEQRVIAWARSLSAAEMGLREIARELTDAGFRTRTGRAWHPQQVKRMLESDLDDVMEPT